MENIAVVGIANLFPGSSAPEEFWQQLLAKQDCRSKAGVEQMGVDVAKYTGKKGDTDKFYCVHGGYIRDFNFDAKAFCHTSNDLTADYLSRLDDLNQWSLYVSQQALKDAGYWRSDKLGNCGVILGNLSFPTKSSNHLFLPLYHQVVDDTLKSELSTDFQLTQFAQEQASTEKDMAIHPDNALVAGFPSALLAKAAGLGGAHFALDAACASSCYSVKLACDYLHTGKADMMLAGAVSAADPMFVNMGFSIFQAYPANNIHAPFDQNSQGLFAGEGAGMMVLKRHSDALRDGDNIHAIIKGGALSNDGKGEFVLSPNTKGQVLVYERAYQDAGVNPADVDYIECHATGTPKGDKVELGSMETFFSRYCRAEQNTAKSKPLLGSVKSNLGHLLTAAGMPGMTKAIWALNEGKIPATINLSQPISSKHGFFTSEQMPTETVAWPERDGKPRTAGVSVFGFGGSNAHLVLQQPTQSVSKTKSDTKPKQSLAIVGMDAHFGDAKNLFEFNDVVHNNTTTFRDLPTKRWKGINNNPAVMQALALPHPPMGGYIEDFSMDFLRFKVPPNEQDCLIPQQLMMMKVADNAAKDAKLTPGKNVAVLVAMGMELELHQYRGRVNLASQIEQSLQAQGVSLTDEQQQTLTNIAKDGVASAAQLNQYTSFIGNIMASRISALWDFSGPAITVSAEENSVYRCVELAQNLFQTSDVEAVIIAGVDLAGSIENITLRQHFGEVNTSELSSKLSSEHLSEKLSGALSAQVDELFDDNRWIVGEGAAAFVVKPSVDTQNQAIDAQQVYATIDAIAFDNNANVQGITTAAQSALQQATVCAEDVVHVEAHASGFKAENALEKQSLVNIYSGKEISSVKKQIGHTFNASGAASIIKTVLCLSKSNKVSQKKRVMAINGLAKDGSCAHLILSAGSHSLNKIQQTSEGSLTEQQQTTAKQAVQLIKTITLGGNAIDEVMIKKSQEAKLAEQISSIKKTFINTQLSANHNPVNLLAIQPRYQQIAANSKKQQSSSTMMNADKSSNGQNKMHANKANMPYPSTLDSQITATHKALLKSRQAAQKNIAQILEAQVAAALKSSSVRTGQAVKIAMQATVAESQSTIESTIASAADSIAHQSINAPSLHSENGFKIKGPKGYHYPALQLKERFNQPKNIIWDTADLVEFAEGDIAKVFGNDYQIIDSYSRRVRLPTTDYLLVSRVTALDAKVNEYKKSYMCTEYDIPVDAPFLIDGQIPWSVSVESGQCDLLLIAFIGIDFQAKGERVYRLLDCELTFLEEMAFGGETLRYEIHIDSYAKNGEQLLFFFHYDCYVGDKKVLIMRNGCAGFFTDEELSDGKGVILNDSDKAQLANAQKSSFTPLLQRNRDTYSYHDMMNLVNGDVAACFGEAYDQKGRNPSLKFSSEKFLMIERITKIEQTAGHWGLGVLEGQKDLDPNHWYFPCHFKDDQVMAGSLMSEGCGQMAMFYMLSLGMHSHVNNARFQPMPGESQTVRCRGQVTPQYNTLTYRMEVTEMGMTPYPYLKANIDIILDGKVVVDFKNLSVMITEQDDNSPYPVTLPDNVEVNHASLANVSKAAVAPMGLQTIDKNAAQDERGIEPFKHPHRPLMKVISDFTAPKEKGVTPIQHFAAPMVTGQNRVPNQAPFTPWHMFEFATGDISKCFGSDFDVYQDRIPPRTPCGDLQVVTQVLEVQGQRLDLKNTASCVSEYYVPEDAWYFSKNSHQNWMPYSLIMEIALQPNGFISGYMGTTLKYPEKDLFFRNLDGSGDLIKQVDLRGKTIINKSELLSTTMAGGMIVQSFTFVLYVKDESKAVSLASHELAHHEKFYQGTAVFGYFGSDALTNQLGIDNGKVTQPWFEDNQTAKSDIKVIDLSNANLPLYQAPVNKPHYKLAGGQMNFIDKVSIVEGGGKAGIAYVHGQRSIDATDWFFRYHFHQDPVMPGSLGVEAIIELMQTYALENDLGEQFINPRFIAPTTMVKWKYRGQITPLNKQMSLDVHITDIVKSEGEVRLVGDANLSKDGLRIYEVKDIVLSIIEA